MSYLTWGTNLGMGPQVNLMIGTGCMQCYCLNAGNPAADSVQSLLLLLLLPDGVNFTELRCLFTGASETGNHYVRASMLAVFWGAAQHSSQQVLSLHHLYIIYTIVVVVVVYFTFLTAIWWFSDFVWGHRMRSKQIHQIGRCTGNDWLLPARLQTISRWKGRQATASAKINDLSCK